MPMCTQPPLHLVTLDPPAPSDLPYGFVCWAAYEDEDSGTEIFETKASKENFTRLMTVW